MKSKTFKIPACIYLEDIHKLHRKDFFNAVEKAGYNLDDYGYLEEGYCHSFDFEEDHFISMSAIVSGHGEDDIEDHDVFLIAKNGTIIDLTEFMTDEFLHKHDLAFGEAYSEWRQCGLEEAEDRREELKNGRIIINDRRGK